MAGFLLPIPPVAVICRMHSIEREIKRNIPWKHVVSTRSRIAINLHNQRNVMKNRTAYRILGALLPFIYLFTSGASQLCFSQTSTKRDVIEGSLVQSYITAGGGLNLGGGHSEKLLFEGDINQHLHFQPRFFGDGVFVKINPRVRVRMINVDSFPIRTPSFMPSATVFFGFGSARNVPGLRGFNVFSVSLTHHSNGQAGSFYNADGSINVEAGSFSTNFFEFGAGRHWGTRSILQRWTRVSLIWHPGFNRDAELDDQYEKVKVGLTTSTVRLTGGLLGWNVESKGSVFYTVVGLDYVLIPGPGSNASRIMAKWDDKINVGASLSIGKPALGDLRFFFKLDYGYDYYNINFWRRLRRIQIGISADPL